MSTPPITLADRLHIQAMVALIESRLPGPNPLRDTKAEKLLKDLCEADLARQEPVDHPEGSTTLITMFGIPARATGKAWDLLAAWAETAELHVFATRKGGTS